jgi:hypothetical protein
VIFHRFFSLSFMIIPTKKPPAWELFVVHVRSHDLPAAPKPYSLAPNNKDEADDDDKAEGDVVGQAGAIHVHLAVRVDLLLG